MSNVEKVIKGLECCKNGFCLFCPYNEHEIDAIKCKSDLNADALALLKVQENEIEELRQEIEGHKDNLQETLDEMMRYADELKAQEPRLVTEADFENADPYGYLPVWVAEKDDNEIICECITKHAITEPDEDYHYRYWTSRPTDEQREAVKWE